MTTINAGQTFVEYVTENTHFVVEERNTVVRYIHKTIERTQEHDTIYLESVPNIVVSRSYRIDVSKNDLEIE